MYAFRNIRKGTFVVLAPIVIGGAAVAQTTSFPGDVNVSSGLKAGTSSSVNNFEFRSNGIFIIKGDWGTATPFLSGDMEDGPKLVWNPGKLSFRAGASYGENSTLGWASAAFGYFTESSGGGSLAFGTWTAAGGFGSLAGGEDFTSASGEAAVALGSANHAIGSFTLSVGSMNTASGYASHAIGEGLLAQARNVAVVGRYNVGGGNSLNWVPTDPLFEIGNGSGTGEAPNSNAITVFKNADTRIGGKLEVKGIARVAPGGDLSMGSFTAGKNPADLDPTIGLDYPQQ